MIDVHTDHLVPLRDYPRIRPPGRNGKPMHITTAYRHAFRGVDGVRLEVVRIGGSYYTSREAIQTFVDELTNRSAARPSPTAATMDSRSDAQADAECVRHGL